MKIQNNTISPETIDFYMQKGKQERSEAIFYSFRWIKRSVQFVFTILKIPHKSGGVSFL